MYSFDEFVEKVENEIKDWLPESAGNFRTEVRDVQKINEVYKGLIVEREGDPVSPTINLSTLYEDFEKIGNFEQVMEAISTMAVMRPEGLEVNMIEKSMSFFYYFMTMFMDVEFFIEVIILAFYFKYAV